MSHQTPDGFHLPVSVTVNEKLIIRLADELEAHRMLCYPPTLGTNFQQVD